MKNQKLILFPLALVFLAVFVSAAGVTTSLFYEAGAASNSLTITNGANVGIIVSADSMFEANMTMKVDLLDSSGNVVNTLLDAYTTSDSYFKGITFGPSEYLGTGSYTIRSTVVAASGQSATDTLSLTVLPVTPTNHVPVITSVAPATVNENTLYQYQVTATDADGDALIYSLVQDPPVGWLSINPQTGLISGVAPNVTADYPFVETVKVSDGKDFVLQTFTIDVRNIVSPPPTNHAPVAQNQNVATNQNTAITIQLVATDADNNTLTYSMVAQPSHGALSGFNSATGQVTYTPSSGYTGSDIFTFRAFDGTNYSNTATVSITVNPVTPTNNNPVITSAAVTSVNESTPYQYQVIATDADSDVLTYSLTTQAPSWLTIDSSTGLLSGTAPAVSADTPYDITITVSDGHNGTDTQTYTLMVLNVVVQPGNNPPVITSTPITSVNEKTTYFYQVTATDADGDTLTYSFTGPSWLTINPTTGLLSGTAPAVAADANFTFVILVSDGTDGTTQTYTLTVLDVPITGRRARGGGAGLGNAVITGNEFEEQQYANQFAPITAAGEEVALTAKGPNSLKILLVLFWLIVFVLLVVLAVLLARRLRR